MPVPRLFPPATMSCGTAEEEGREKGSLLAEACVDGLSPSSCKKSGSPGFDRMGVEWNKSCGSLWGNEAILDNIHRFQKPSFLVSPRFFPKSSAGL